MSSRRPPPPKPRNWPLVVGLLSFTGFMCAVPLLLQKRHRRLTQGVPMAEQDRNLTGAEVRRGAYLNTGSRDAGPDPDWDKGLYKGAPPSIIDETTGLTAPGSRGMRASPGRDNRGLHEKN